MSYDISIVDEKGKQMQSPIKHNIIGGTYCVGGTTDLWLSVTYNYHQQFKKAFEQPDGIRCLNGKPCMTAMMMIRRAMDKLGDDVTNRYWDSTDGNAKEALANLLKLCALGCDGYVEVE